MKKEQLKKCNKTLRFIWITCFDTLDYVSL